MIGHWCQQQLFTYRIFPDWAKNRPKNRQILCVTVDIPRYTGWKLCLCGRFSSTARPRCCAREPYCLTAASKLTLFGDQAEMGIDQFFSYWEFGALHNMMKIESNPKSWN